MSTDSNYQPGLRAAQTDNTTHAFQKATLLRGIVVDVQPHAGLAIVEVEGGDPACNPRDIIVLSTKPGNEGVLETATNVGSMFTCYSVKAANVKTGDYVNLQFIQGNIRPTVVSVEPNIKSDVPADPEPVIVLDQKTKKPTLITGGAETAWTKKSGISGYKFSAFSQSPNGAMINVATTNSLDRLATAPTITPAVVRQALETSTPAGQAVYVENNVGHVATFGDAVTTIAKEQNDLSVGSNAPVGSSLTDPLLSLAEVFRIQEPDSILNMRFDSKMQYRISPLMCSLAEQELLAWQNKDLGYVNLSQITEAFFSGSGNTGNLATSLKTAAKNNNNANLNYYISSAVAAGSYTVGSLLLSGQNLFQNVSGLNILPINLETSDNPAFLEYLDGTGLAWANLVAALRLSILTCTEALALQQGLSTAGLVLYKKITDSTSTQSMLIPNLFGFPSKPVGNYGLAGSKTVLVTTSLPEAFSLATKTTGSDIYTYGDIIHLNYHAILNESAPWVGDDVYVPNMIALAGDESRFVDRLHFGANGRLIPGTETTISVDSIKHWVIGLYAAQVRTLIQEIYYLSLDYATDIVEGTGTNFTGYLRPVSDDTAVIIDDDGISHQSKLKAWSSSFISYLMIRLFTGETGRKVANEVISTYAGKTDVFSEEEFKAILAKYSGNFTEPRDNAWWSSLASRYVIVANSLARVNNFWRS